MSAAVAAPVSADAAGDPDLGPPGADRSRGVPAGPGGLGRLVRAARARRLAPLRRHLPFALLVAATGSRWPPVRRALLAIAAAGYARRYLVGRRLARLRMAEHEDRIRRLRPDVLRHFYVTCIGSMEAELETYPAYDRRKHERRYALVSETAARHTAPGAVVVDVGCASGLVLDRLHADLGTVGIGFDLSPHGVRDRAGRADPPLLSQAVVEAIPLPDAVADTVVFSEVIEHLADPWTGMREVGRITRQGGTLVLTTNNGSEMPEESPTVDPLLWVERLAGRWAPRILAFRNLTWFEPINDPADPLPRGAPTYAPHYHLCFAELRDLAEDAGFRLLGSGSFEFPPPQTGLAGLLRRLTACQQRIGDAVSDAVERCAAAAPGVRLMGTHHLLLFRREGPVRSRPRRPFGPALLVGGASAVDGLGYAAGVASLPPDLLELLVCPQCKGELVVEESALRCDSCRLRYPVDDGIPIMLIDSALPVTDDGGAPPAAEGGG